MRINPDDLNNLPGPDEVVETPNSEIDLGPDPIDKNPLGSTLQRHFETYEQSRVSAHFDDSYPNKDGGMSGELF